MIGGIDSPANTRSLLAALGTSRLARSYLGGIPDDAMVNGGVVDGYGRPMQYTWQGNDREPPAIISAGADGLLGTSDDVIMRLGETAATAPEGS